MTYDEFFDHYLREHRSSRSRALHYAGTALGTLVFLFGVVSSKLLLLPVALILGYGPAWVGHFFIEHNRPATFRHPLWSLLSDYRMLYLWLTGRLKPALAAAEWRFHAKPAAD